MFAGFQHGRHRLRAVTITLVAVGALVGIGAPAADAGTAGSAGLFFLPIGSGSGVIYQAGVQQDFPLGGLTSTTQAYSGHFSGQTGGDLIIYDPGHGASIIHDDGGTSYSIDSLNVAGIYQPLIGDFDGNGIDDIFWYGSGTSPDSLWLFRADGTHKTVAVNVSGTYRPTVLDANGDGRSDILWYGPGSAPDSLWLFGPGALTHASVAESISGTYTVVAGHFGKPATGQPADRIVFYNPSGTDFFWTFDTSGNHTSAVLPNIDGNYQLIPGQFLEETYGSLFFYAPGSTPEHLWAFGPGPGGDVSEQTAPQVNGTYNAQAADFDGNGLTDISFTSGTKSIIWKFQIAGPIVQTVLTGLPSPSLVHAIPLK